MILGVIFIGLIISVAPVQAEKLVADTIMDRMMKVFAKPVIVPKNDDCHKKWGSCKW